MLVAVFVFTYIFYSFFACARDILVFLGPFGLCAIAFAAKSSSERARARVIYLSGCINKLYFVIKLPEYHLLVWLCRFAGGAHVQQCNAGNCSAWKPFCVSVSQSRQLLGVQANQFPQIAHIMTLMRDWYASTQHTFWERCKRCLFSVEMIGFHLIFRTNTQLTELSQMLRINYYSLPDHVLSFDPFLFMLNRAYTCLRKQKHNFVSFFLSIDLNERLRGIFDEKWITNRHPKCYICLQCVWFLLAGFSERNFTFRAELDRYAKNALHQMHEGNQNTNDQSK